MSSIVVLQQNYCRLGVAWDFFQNWVQFGESPLKANNSQLLVNLSSHYYWSIMVWAPRRYTGVILDCRAAKIQVITSYNLFWCFCLSQVCVLLCGQQRKRKSAKSHVIKGGSPGPLIGLCCPGLFIQMIGCPFGNVYSDWKGHLACHKIKVRSDCQHAIWDYRL